MGLNGAFWAVLATSYARVVIKPFVVGRKSRLFFDTDKDADASAKCYSIIESAKANKGWS